MVEKLIKKMGYQVKWGDNHIKNFNKIDEAKLFAYHKAFYFETYFDGVLVKRVF